MSSRGEEETRKLKENLESQVERLIQQLADLEEVKEELDPSEYSDTKEETLEQLKEFNERLSKMMSGNMTLVDELGSIQLAIQTAISDAFSTPDVIRMFARREPKQLKQRLSEKERDFKLGHILESEFRKDKKEILTAIKQLGEKLTVEEHKFLEDMIHGPKVKNFEKVTEDTGGLSSSAREGGPGSMKENVEAVVRQVTQHVKNLAASSINKPG